MRNRSTFARTVAASSLAVLAGGIFLPGCSSDTSDGVEDVIPKNAGAAIATYAQIVAASYADTANAAQDLAAAVDEFIEDPSEASLENAKQSWLAAREPYLQTETYRFYNGPIDDADSGVEGMVNAWPLDEAYIDSVVGDEDAGLINDTDVEISAETLVELNEQGGEENIATGFHAIEFLLWGQDHSDDGPGDRPYTDFTEEGDAPNPERRALYLKTVSELLVEHLEGVSSSWVEGKNNYRKDFEKETPRESLRKILTGMIVLSGFETGGERLQAALDSGNQEDEHSCFSDNTHRDMIQDIQGVKNVWLGEYKTLSGEKVSGTSIRDVVGEVDRTLADEIDARINTSLELAGDLHIPFDQEIASDNDAGRARVSALVVALSDQADSLQDAFEALELQVTGE